MKEDKRVTQQDIDEASVRLQPILGIKPGLYLAVLYMLVILAILFMVFVLPGLRSPGTLFYLVSDPPGSAVYIDGVWQAATPAELFIAAGDHTIRIEQPGFAVHQSSINVRGRLIASSFFPRRDYLSVVLEPAVPVLNILASGIKEFSWWSLAGQPSEAYQHPMVLSDAAVAWTAALRRHKAGSNPDIVPAFIAAALSYASNAAAVRDAVRAASITALDAVAVTPGTLATAVDTMLRTVAADPALLAVLAGSLPAEPRTRLENSAVYRRMADQAASLRLQQPTIRLAGVTGTAVGEFIAFHPGTTIMRPTGALAYGVALESYALAAAETTVGQFRSFLDAVPAWNVSAKASLQSANLVDEAYLANFSQAADDEPVRFVSRHAAQAYAAWLSDTAAPNGHAFVLPTEAQWNGAAQAMQQLETARIDSSALASAGRVGPSPVAALRTDAAGFRGLIGNVWEWCSDAFAHSAATGVAGRELFPGYDGIVRGGSWANRADLVDLNARGAMPPESCNPYTGFRLALVRTGE